MDGRNFEELSDGEKQVLGSAERTDETTEESSEDGGDDKNAKG